MMKHIYVRPVPRHAVNSDLEFEIELRAQSSMEELVDIKDYAVIGTEIFTPLSKLKLLQPNQIASKYIFSCTLCFFEVNLKLINLFFYFRYQGQYFWSWWENNTSLKNRNNVWTTRCLHYRRSKRSRIIFYFTLMCLIFVLIFLWSLSNSAQGFMHIYCSIFLKRKFFVFFCGWYRFFFHIIFLDNAFNFCICVFLIVVWIFLLRITCNMHWIVCKSTYAQFINTFLSCNTCF